MAKVRQALINKPNMNDGGTVVLSTLSHYVMDQIDSSLLGIAFKTLYQQKENITG